MPAQTSGLKNAAIKQIDARLESDRFGVDMLTMVEELHRSLFPSGLRAMGSGHPNYSNMAVSRRFAERGNGGEFWRVSYLYEGYFNSLPQPTYDLDGSLDQAPIATHPDFLTLAGTPEEPANGAVFEDGIFREFGGVAAGVKQGIDSYMEPGATWTKTSFSLTTPSLRPLGKIDSPDGSPPTLPGRNWLFWATSARQRGHIWELRETWKLSGRTGWDTDIY